MKELALFLLIAMHPSEPPRDEMANFERSRGDYSDGIAYGPKWVFCRERTNPTDRGDCTDRPWRKPQ